MAALLLGAVAPETADSDPDMPDVRGGLDI